MNTIRKIYRSILCKPESKESYLKRASEDLRDMERFYLKHRSIFEECNSYDPMLAEYFKKEEVDHKDED